VLGDNRIFIAAFARALGLADPKSLRRKLKGEQRTSAFQRLTAEAILKRAGIRWKGDLWTHESEFVHPFFEHEALATGRWGRPGVERFEGFGEARLAGPTRKEKVPMAQKIGEEALKRFRLERDPFLNELHSSEDVFKSRAHKSAEWELMDAAAHQYFIALVGKIGAGKTVVVKLLLDRISKNPDFKVSRLRCVEKEQATAYGIMEALIRDYSSDARPMHSREGRARQIGALLESMVQARKKPVLVIDEAHALNTQTLRSLKRLYDESEVGFRRSIAIILVGQDTNKDKSYNLRDKLGNWDLREVSERCRLVSLGGLGAEIGDYVAWKFAKAGSRREIVTADALRLVRKIATENPDGGWDAPLVINNLLATAMNLAHEVGKDTINAELMGEAIAKCADAQ